MPKAENEGENQPRQRLDVDRLVGLYGVSEGFLKVWMVGRELRSKRKWLVGGWVWRRK